MAGLFFGEIKNTGALYEKVHFLPVFEVNRKIKTKDNKIEIKINRTIIKKDTKGCCGYPQTVERKGKAGMKKQVKILLAAAVAAAISGGVVSAADFPTSGSTTVTEDTEYTSTGTNTSINGTVTITGDTSRPTVSVSDTADHATTPNTTEHGIIYATGSDNTLTVSNLGALNINSASAEKDAVVGLNVWNGGAITVSDVDSVNIGTADAPFSTDNYAIQTIGGNVTMTNVGDVNIYTTEVGISAQYGADGKSDSVVIDSYGDVNIHTDTTAVRAMALGGNKTAGVSIQADGKVTLTSANGDTVQANDAAGEWTGTGNTSIKISGDEGVDIQAAANHIAVYMTKAHGQNSELNITSANGDVNITGGNGIQTNLTDGILTGTIKGQNVTISSPAASAISMNNNAESNLTLAVNQDGGQITVSTAKEGGNAISVSGNKSSLTLGDGEHATDVNINGYVKVTGADSQLTFADKTTTYVDSKYLTNEKQSFITTGGTGTVTFADGAKLDIGNVAAETKLYFSDDQAVSQEAAAAIKTDNVLQKFTVDSDGAIKAETVDNKEAAKLLGGSLLTNVALAATGDAKYADVKALVDGDNAKEALDSAAGLAAMANVAHGTYTMNGIFSDAVSGHLMNRQDQDVWAYGFHSKENVNGLSFGADYDAQYNSIAAGADFYKKGGTTAGLALIYADSNVSGSNGFATTKNDADYYGVSLYSRFDRGSYALLGDISYMKGDHDVTQMNKGQIITASPDSDSISVGVKAVKDYAAGENGTLTPYVGLRYLRLSTDDFTASNGLRYEGDDQDLVIVPVGVNYTAAISHGKWSVRPYAGIGYVWTAGDRSADQTVMLGTAADSFSYDTADSGSFIARAGVTTDCGDMSYGIGYSWQKGDSVSNNAWTLSASYHF